MTGTAAQPGYAIRSAVAADRSAVEQMLIASKLPTAGVSTSLDGFLVAESGSDVIGAIGLERYGDYGLLRSAAVEPSWQGKGVGRALVEELLSSARASGLRGVYLLTTTAEGYFPAFGFTRVDRESVPQEVRESVEFADACPASAAVQYLDLQENPG